MTGTGRNQPDGTGRNQPEGWNREEPARESLTEPKKSGLCRRPIRLEGEAVPMLHPVAQRAHNCSKVDGEVRVASSGQHGLEEGGSDLGPAVT